MHSRGLRVFWVWVAIVIASAVTLWIGMLFGGRAYVITSFLLVGYSLVPAFYSFETRKPEAREIVLIAILSALAIAARVVFAPVPFFKPVLGIIMLAGLALGPNRGFLVGAVTALVSNFLFGQGPWTPWQMLAYGLAGSIMGWVGQTRFGTRVQKGTGASAPLLLGAGGAALVMVFIGPLMDTSSAFYLFSNVSIETLAAIYIAGIPVNAVQAVATFFTIWLLARPFLTRMRRIKTKYGLMDQDRRPLSFD